MLSGTDDSNLDACCRPSRGRAAPLDGLGLSWLAGAGRAGYEAAMNSIVCLTPLCRKGSRDRCLVIMARNHVGAEGLFKPVNARYNVGIGSLDESW